MAHSSSRLALVACALSMLSLVAMTFALDSTGSESSSMSSQGDGVITTSLPLTFTSSSPVDEEEETTSTAAASAMPPQASAFLAWVRSAMLLASPLSPEQVDAGLMLAEARYEELWSTASSSAISPSSPHFLPSLAKAVYSLGVEERTFITISLGERFSPFLEELIDDVASVSRPDCTPIPGRTCTVTPTVTLAGEGGQATTATTAVAATYRVLGAGALEEGGVSSGFRMPVHGFLLTGPGAGSGSSKKFFVFTTLEGFRCSDNDEETSTCFVGSSGPLAISHDEAAARAKTMMAEGAERLLRHVRRRISDEVEGNSINNSSSTTSSTFTLRGRMAGAAHASGPARTVLAIRCTFTDYTATDTTKLPSLTYIRDELLSVSNLFELESFGQVTLTRDVPEYTYTLGTLTLAGFQEGDETDLLNAATAAVTSSSLASTYRRDPDAYDHFEIWFPATNALSWAGLGQRPGRVTWIQGNYQANVVSHELGHNFGLAHAGTIAWEDKSHVEYGDHSDVMGSGGEDEAHFQGGYKHGLGWIPDGKVLTLSSSADAGGGTSPYALQPVTSSVYAMDAGLAIASMPGPLTMRWPLSGGTGNPRWAYISHHARLQGTSNGIVINEIFMSTSTVGASTLVDAGFATSNTQRDAEVDVGSGLIYDPPGGSGLDAGVAPLLIENLGVATESVSSTTVSKVTVRASRLTPDTYERLLPFTRPCVFDSGSGAGNCGPATASGTATAIACGVSAVYTSEVNTMHNVAVFSLTGTSTSSSNIVTVSTCGTGDGSGSSPTELAVYPSFPYAVAYYGAPLGGTAFQYSNFTVRTPNGGSMESKSCGTETVNVADGLTRYIAVASSPRGTSLTISLSATCGAPATTTQSAVPRIKLTFTGDASSQSFFGGDYVLSGFLPLANGKPVYEFRRPEGGSTMGYDGKPVYLGWSSSLSSWILNDQAVFAGSSYVRFTHGGSGGVTDIAGKSGAAGVTVSAASACPHATYATGGTGGAAPACTPCPLYAESPVGSTASSSCVCPPGRTMSGGACVACAADTSKSTWGNDACTACDTGFTAGAGAAYCSAVTPPKTFYVSGVSSTYAGMYSITTSTLNGRPIYTKSDGKAFQYISGLPAWVVAVSAGSGSYYTSLQVNTGALPGSAWTGNFAGTGILSGATPAATLVCASGETVANSCLCAVNNVAIENVCTPCPSGWFTYPSGVPSATCYRPSCDVVSMTLSAQNSWAGGAYTFDSSSYESSTGASIAYSHPTNVNIGGTVYTTIYSYLYSSSVAGAGSATWYIGTASGGGSSLFSGALTGTTPSAQGLTSVAQWSQNGNPTATYTCTTCAKGYYLSSGACVACASGKSTPSSGATSSSSCANCPTGTLWHAGQCLCPAGYTFNNDKTACVDINECSTVSCDTGTTCYNGAGTYKCLSSTSPCPPGTVLEESTLACNPCSGFNVYKKASGGTAASCVCPFSSSGTCNPPGALTIAAGTASPSTTLAALATGLTGDFTLSSSTLTVPSSSGGGVAALYTRDGTASLTLYATLRSAMNGEDGVMEVSLSSGNTITSPRYGYSFIAPTGNTNSIEGNIVMKVPDTTNVGGARAFSYPVAGVLSVAAVAVPSTTPSASPTTTVSLTATGSKSPSITGTVSATVTVTTTISPSLTPSPTPSLSNGASSSNSPTPTVSGTVSPTVTVTATISPTTTVSPSLTLTASVTPTYSPTTTVSPSPTVTRTVTVSVSPTVTVSPSFTPTPTISFSPSPSAAGSSSPTSSTSPSPSPAVYRVRLSFALTLGSAGADTNALTTDPAVARSLRSSIASSLNISTTATESKPASRIIITRIRDVAMNTITFYDENSPINAEEVIVRRLAGAAADASTSTSSSSSSRFFRMLTGVGSEVGFSVVVTENSPSAANAAAAAAAAVVTDVASTPSLVSSFVASHGAALSLTSASVTVDTSSVQIVDLSAPPASAADDDGVSLGVIIGAAVGGAVAISLLAVGIHKVFLKKKGTSKVLPSPR